MKTEERCSQKVERINNTEMSFTMTLANVTHQDTGHFQFVIGDMEIKQYVYVFGSFSISY